MTKLLLRSVGRALAITVIASALAACSKSGGSLTPPVTNSGPAASSVASPSRFIQSAAVTATNDTPFSYTPDAVLKPMSSYTPDGGSPLPAPSTCVAAYGLACYVPSQIRAAYNVPSSLDGTGQTIVIVDAFGSPTIASDLKTFSSVFSLPPAKLNILYPTGQPASQNDGWAGETTLDVEWAHAIAPGATIDLVIAPSNLDTDLHAAEQYVIDNHLGSVMSMSFGAPEQAISGGVNNRHMRHADDIYQEAIEAGITSIASSGDSGAEDGQPVPTANFPASDPFVLSVGGTNLFMTDAGAYTSEDVWNDSDPSLCPNGCAYGAFGATGGAPSILFTAPSYQRSLTHEKARTVADVSYDGSVYTAVMVVRTSPLDGKKHYYFTGGTSAGAPQWAGIVALANQSTGESFGFINKKLYSIAKQGSYASAFHDVTVGQNGFGGPGFSAGPGYDIPTGLGTPNVANLINALNGEGDRGDRSYRGE
ncbi:MAG TPA: S53 family peptidase [Candidatus Baltobacteraceae bacterium]|jgi:subtilase family serine protease